MDGKMFFGSQASRLTDSGTVRARPNRILEFQLGHKLFILHSPLNAGMGWARAGP